MASPGSITTRPVRQRSRQRSGRTWRGRIFGWIIRALLVFFLGSILWVLAYRVIAPPVTMTMLMDPNGYSKKWMPLSRIDPDMARAAIAAEDGKFCHHHGFDTDALAAAMLHDVEGGRIRGGSTISQQTAKNAFLWQGGGFLRKGMEAWFTLLIETLWGKKRIMEVYLNVAETGIGTYGVNAGALRYYHHDASRLTRAEAARIAAVLPLPKKRAVIDPHGFVRRYGNNIVRRVAVVQNGGLDSCLR